MNCTQTSQNDKDFSSEALKKLGDERQKIEKDYDEYCDKAIVKNNVDTMYKLALYHQSMNDYEQMEKYYKMAIGHGDSIAMNDLAHYHQNITEDYEHMEKYYKMAIRLGNSCAMFNFGYYHQNTTKDYIEMGKYYLMAIEKGDADALYQLGLYYESVSNYEQMKKYYIMAIEHGDSEAMYQLGYYYEGISDREHAEKYYLMAIENNNSDAMYQLGLYYHYSDHEQAEKYYLMAIEHDHDDSVANLEHLYDNSPASLKSLKFFYKYDLDTFNKKLSSLERFYTAKELEFLTSIDQEKITNWSLRQLIKLLKEKFELMDLHAHLTNGETIESFKSQFLSKIDN